MRPKPINNLNEKALPQVKMDENIAISEHHPQSVNRIRKVLMFLEPKGCMKERDEFALYIFSPNNK